MAKTWEQMTSAEKIEDLRRDMKATIAMVNTWINHQRQLETSHNALASDHAKTASQVSAVVEVLRILGERVSKVE